MTPISTSYVGCSMPPSSRSPRGRGPDHEIDDGVHHLCLPKFLEAELKAGHPWVYRNHIPSDFRAATGTWVRARAGETSVWGLWDNESQLSIRIYSHRGPLDGAEIALRVQHALMLRRALLSSDTNAFRLINGEGDGLPAIVVDVYGPYAVVATYGLAVQVIVPLIVEAVKQLLSPAAIVVRRMTSEGSGSATVEWVHGQAPPDDFCIDEHGARFFADLTRGHKTGLYLDQRENRRTFAQFTRGGLVLNLYAYTGGFSVIAALAGARRVTSVDIAEPVLARAKDNFRLNGLDPADHQFIVQDCYEYLKANASGQEQFDAIVCDPPSMARNRAQLEDALKAYLRINTLGLRLVRHGGFYAASSCTAQVSPEAFRKVLAQAARRAGRRAQIVHESGHAWDHPVNLGHPEGRYLKFIVLYVTDGEFGTVQ
jgi:23S rRNA (cytosine1962-C5)-methyltransferase